MSPKDKWGRCDHPHYLMQGFRDAIHDARLIDIDLIGHQFTWWFAMGTSNTIEQCLDCALATKKLYYIPK